MKMKKIIFIFICFIFVAVNSFAISQNSKDKQTQTTKAIDNIEYAFTYQQEDFVEEVQDTVRKNMGLVVTVAALAFFLILFILFYLSAREKAVKRKKLLKVKQTEFTKFQSRLKNKQDTIKSLEEQNKELNIHLEREKAKNENLNIKISEFRQQSETLGAKIDKLQEKINAQVVEDAKKKISDIEISTAKIENLKRLRETGAISEEEFQQRKKDILTKMNE